MERSWAEYSIHKRPLYIFSVRLKDSTSSFTVVHESPEVNLFHASDIELENNSIIKDHTTKMSLWQKKLKSLSIGDEQLKE